MQPHCEACWPLCPRTEDLGCPPYPVDGATERLATLQSAALPHLRTGALRWLAQQTASQLPEHQISVDPADCGTAGAARTLSPRLFGHEPRRTWWQSLFDPIVVFRCA